jgi:glycosyltransferase involved in cell wall biosynthesis
MQTQSQPPISSGSEIKKVEIEVEALEKGCPSVTVVVPTYNEERTIGQVLSELTKIESKVRPLEIIVVDDGSSDRTKDEVAKFPSVIYIRHQRNMGKGMALRTGLKIGRGKAVVIQDADMEYSPTEIPQLVKPILDGRADVVYGSRFIGKRNGMSFSHLIGNVILSSVASLLYRENITDIMTGHKAFSRKVLGSLRLKENGFSVEVELTAQVLKNGWKILEIPIGYSYRTHGAAKIRYRDGLGSLLKLLSSTFAEN